MQFNSLQQLCYLGMEGKKVVARFWYLTADMIQSMQLSLFVVQAILSIQRETAIATEHDEAFTLA